MNMNSREISNVLQNGAPVTQQVGAYNTYVGARYVPIFDGEWDATKQYEPLVIVTNGGDSYTSKQYVPAGTPVTNETFWAHTGNWNGQLESLRQEVINNSISINEIESELATINDKFYIFIGDSFADVTSSYTGWITQLVNKLGLTSDNYWSEQGGGAGFSRGVGGTGKNFVDFINDVPVNLNNKVTDIIVLTAGNDYYITDWNNTLMVNAINDFTTACKKFTKLQKITLHLCFNATGHLPASMNLFNLQYLLNAPLVINQDSKYYHLNCSYFRDVIHPTTQGANFLTNQIYANMFNMPSIIDSGYVSVTENGLTIGSNLTESGVKFQFSGSITLDTASSYFTALEYAEGKGVYLIKEGSEYGQVTIYNSEYSYSGYLVRNANNLQVTAHRTIPAGTYNVIGIVNCSW